MTNREKWINNAGSLHYYLDGKWTGYRITKLRNIWAKPYKPVTFHIADDIHCQAIANSRRLKFAKELVRNIVDDKLRLC